MCLLYLSALLLLHLRSLNKVAHRDSLAQKLLFEKHGLASLPNSA